MVEKEIAIKSVKKMNRISEIYTHISTGEVGGGKERERAREKERTLFQPTDDNDSFQTVVHND